MQVGGDYTVSVQFFSYSNPSHRRHNGVCCDRPTLPYFDCFGDCDNYFKVCVEYGDEREACLYTGEVGDADDLHFTTSVGRLSNPILFNLTGPLTVRTMI